jgi:hypothetical protein
MKRNLMQPQTVPNPYDTPPWRRSHKAVSPNGSLAAEIKEAIEHSMSNPTVGTLRISNGLELAKCNPAFIWSDDSRYLAVPQWRRRFGFFLRQRLAIVDVVDRTVYASPFNYWLIEPLIFECGKLECLVSGSLGISWPRKTLVLEVPTILVTFTKLLMEC